jgi:hypothetical protein
MADNRTVRSQRLQRDSLARSSLPRPSLPRPSAGELARPSFILVYATDAAELRRHTSAFAFRYPGVPCVGATSLLGLFERDGFSAVPAALIAEESDGLTMHATMRSAQPRNAAEQARQAALELRASVGRPDLLLLHGTPGIEERLLEGVQAVFGADVPVCGGTAAAPGLHGGWLVCSGEAATDAGFVLAAVSSLHGLSHGFSSGFLPSEHRGVVTRARGRAVLEIDGKPAAGVYDTWTEGLIHQELARGGDVLAKTNLRPVARTVAGGVGLPRRLLSHPHSVLAPEQALTFFSELREGDTIELMTSTLDPLVQRVGRLVERTKPTSAQVRGGLLVYCAGTLAVVRERAPEIAAQFARGLGGAPFVGIATYGEQGCFFDRGLAFHGNLMCGTVLF